MTNTEKKRDLSIIRLPFQEREQTVGVVRVALSPLTNPLLERSSASMAEPGLCILYLLPDEQIVGFQLGRQGVKLRKPPLSLGPWSCGPADLPSPGCLSVTP